MCENLTSWRRCGAIFTLWKLFDFSPQFSFASNKTICKEAWHESRLAPFKHSLTSCFPIDLNSEQLYLDNISECWTAAIKAETSNSRKPRNCRWSSFVGCCCGGMRPEASSFSCWHIVHRTCSSSHFQWKEPAFSTFLKECQECWRQVYSNHMFEVHCGAARSVHQAASRRLVTSRSFLFTLKSFFFFKLQPT